MRRGAHAYVSNMSLDTINVWLVKERKIRGREWKKPGRVRGKRGAADKNNNIGVKNDERVFN